GGGLLGGSECRRHEDTRSDQQTESGRSRSFAPSALRMTGSLAPRRKRKEKPPSVDLLPFFPFSQGARACRPERGRGTRAKRRIYGRHIATAHPVPASVARRPAARSSANWPRGAPCSPRAGHSSRSERAP